MDVITKHKLHKAAEELIASIDPAKVCELASFFHPDKRPCQIFKELKKGGFNVCFPVIFEGGGEKWMVRIPLLPRLAFPEEKMRSEIATMKYIAEKTTIPIPRLHGYSVTRDNILGLPFMLVEYIEGRSFRDATLEDRDPEESKIKRLTTQLAGIYFQLSLQQFDRIGAFTLDENDDHWVFNSNRPLTVDVNEQEVGGLDICRYLPPHQSFTSAIDYIFFIVKLIFNDFYRRRDSIADEADARNYLYSIHMSQSILMEWIKPEFNHGPFILSHSDLATRNIMIDDDYNIVAILDWEWSHTVPVQLFVPPSWLANTEWGGVPNPSSKEYLTAAHEFVYLTHEQEDNYYNQQRPRQSLPITTIWPAGGDDLSLSIAHSLLKPLHFGAMYYAEGLDSKYHGEDDEEAEKQVKAFFNLKLRQPELHAVEQKVLELAGFEKEREELGINPRPNDEEELKRLQKLNAEWAKEDEERRAKNAEIEKSFVTPPGEDLNVQGASEAEPEKVRMYWPLMTIGAVYLVYLVSRNWRR